MRFLKMSANLKKARVRYVKEVKSQSFLSVLEARLYNPVLTSRTLNEAITRTCPDPLIAFWGRKI